MPSMKVQYKNRAVTRSTEYMTAVQWDKMGDHTAVVEVHLECGLLVAGVSLDPKAKPMFGLKVGFPERIVSQVNPGNWILEGVNGSLTVLTDFSLNHMYDPWYPVDEELARAVGAEMGIESAWPAPLGDQKPIVNGYDIWNAAIKVIAKYRN